MARFLFLLFIFANALLNSVAGAEFGAEPPSSRKLGKHRSAASEAPRSEMKVQGTSAAASGGESGVRLENHQHHKSSDKSIAGGGVILGGLATTFLVAVICYIRATRRSNSEVK